MARGITVDLIVDPSGAIKGLGQVEDKSSNVAGALGKLGGLAAAGVVALGTAAIAAAGALTAATLSAGAYAEEVELAASKTHLTTDAVQELQYASKITGVDFETITNSMTKLTKSMGAAQAGTGAQADAFAALGVATTDANGNLLDSTVVYSNVIAALGEIENPAERDVLAMQLLGKSATDLNPLIDGSAGSLTDLAAAAHEAGAVLSGDTLARLASVDDAFDQLGAGADAAKNALGLVLLPVLQQLGDEGTGLLGRFTNAVLDADGDLSKAAPAIGAVFGDAVTFLLGQVPQFLAVGTSIISSLLAGVVQQAPTLITQAIPVLVGFVTSLLGQLPLLLDAGYKILISLVQGVAAALPTLIPAAIDAIIGLVSAIVDNAPMMLEAGLQLILGLATGLIEAIPGLIAELPKIIIGLVTYFVGAIPKLIQAGVDLLLALVEAMPEIVDGVVKAIPLIITGVLGALIGAIPQIIGAGVQLLVALVTNLPTIIMTIIKAIPQIVSGIFGAFTSPAMIGQLATAGDQLIRGLWQGISAAGGWLWAQVSGFMNGLISNVKSLFGIHSPSKVFAGIGGLLVEGLEVGLSGPNHLGSVVSGLADQVTGGFNAALNVSNVPHPLSELAASRGDSRTVVVNVTNIHPVARPESESIREAQQLAEVALSV